MQIERLKIDKLYGYIDKEVDFNRDLTLLVGINGSGKTSILNILNWILRPSLPNLCVTEFNTIHLTFKFKKLQYEVTCKHNRATFYYKIKSEKEVFNPLIVRIHTRPSEIRNDERLKDSLIERYTGLTPNNKEQKTWDLISKFPNPTIIGLDRNLYTEESSEHVYFEESVRRKIIGKRQRVSINPLERVKEIINREYRKSKNSILNLTNHLKNHLMLSTFDGSISVKSFTSGIKYKVNLNQIENAEKRVKEYFRSFEKKSFSKDQQLTISNYFSELKSITKRYQEKPNDNIVQLLYGLNANQFIKVRKLLNEFEKFETQSLNAMEHISNYIKTLNHFLKDSAKEILFKEDTSELTFNTFDKDRNIINQYKDIRFLSSGEQQILILFSYIAFNSQDGKIFIIDEPELSLHIKWQEDFLEMLDTITPKSTQIILATHSPILANKKKEKARTLFTYNG